MTANPHAPEELDRQIVKASATVGIAHVTLKLAGLLQVVILGSFVDQSVLDAVYVFAFQGCVFALFLIGEEVVGPTFLPVFMRQMETRDENEAWRFASTVLTLHLLVLLTTVLALVCFPGAIVEALTAWSPTQEPEQYMLARRSLMWTAPALICLSLGSTTYMILNGYKRFFLAAFGDASWKLCVLASVGIGIGLFGWDYRCLIFGLLVGSVAKLLTHLAGLVREFRFFRPVLGVHSPAFKRMMILMLPLIAGIVFAKGRDLFNNVTILSGLSTAGLMTANTWGKQLSSAIGWLVPYTLSIAMFPFFCEMVDRDDQAGLGRVLTHSGRLLLAVFIPVSMVFLVAAPLVTSVIYEWGDFALVNWTSVSLACYTLVLPAAALEFLLMQAFFANRKMISVTVAGLATSLLSILVSGIGIWLFKVEGFMALIVVACGFTLSRTVKTLVLVAILKRSIPMFPRYETLVLVLRAVAVGVLATGGCWFACRASAMFGLDGTTKLRAALQLGCGVGGAGIGYLGGAWGLRLREPFEMLQWGLKRAREFRR